MFAATPPLEGKRLLVSRAVTRRKDRKKLRFTDVKKAHLNPECFEDVFIELPEEAGRPEGVCGKLRFWLYGFRKAASAWEDMYAKRFEQAGFGRGRSCGVLFQHPARDVQCVVHGDDFTFCGLEEDLDWITELMKMWFQIKVRSTLGPEDKYDKEVVILGRILRWRIGASNGRRIRSIGGRYWTTLDFVKIEWMASLSTGTRGEEKRKRATWRRWEAEMQQRFAGSQQG